MNNSLHVAAKGDVDDVDLKAAFRREGLEGHLDGSLMCRRRWRISRTV
jgi:hypothetical protein